MEKKLYRDEHNKIISGVCAGLAEYFSMDVTVMRLIFAFGFFIWGVGFIPYIILWIVLPKKFYGPFTTPADRATVDYIVPPVTPGNPVTPNQPFTPFVPKKQTNTGGIIVGFILIFIGGIALLHQYNIFFFWHLHHWFFPVILVALGVSLIAKGQHKHPWEHTGWHEATPKTGAETLKEDAPDTNPPTEQL